MGLHIWRTSGWAGKVFYCSLQSLQFLPLVSREWKNGSSSSSSSSSYNCTPFLHSLLTKGKTFGGGLLQLAVPLQSYVLAALAAGCSCSLALAVVCAHPKGILKPKSRN